MARMAITVDTLTREVMFGAVGVAEVVQNVRTILTTNKGTVPLDREFGIDLSFLDDPFPRAQATIQSEIFRKIRRYEPRAIVKEITFVNDPLSGKMSPTVKIEVKL